MPSDHVYKTIELVGSSPTGIEDAVNAALGRADKTLRNMHWMQISEVRGAIAGGKVSAWQVTMKVGFTLE
jgi:dodecin